MAKYDLIIATNNGRSVIGPYGNKREAVAARYRHIVAYLGARPRSAGWSRYQDGDRVTYDHPIHSSMVFRIARHDPTDQGSRG